MPAGTPGISAAYDAQRKKTTGIAIAAGLVALLLATFVTLNATGVLGAKGNRADDRVLVAQGQRPDGTILQAQGERGAPVMQRSAEVVAPVKMPGNIYDWLKHLEKCEAERIAVTTGQVGEAMTEQAKLKATGGVDAIQDALNGIDDPNAQLRSPTEGLARLLKMMHDQTMQVQQRFQAVPPPAECGPIAAAYTQALNETAAQMGEIGDHLAAGDVQKLLTMKGKSNEGIDSAGKRTDRLVGEICNKYNTAKWFSVSGDILPGGIFGASSGF